MVFAGRVSFWLTKDLSFKRWELRPEGTSMEHVWLSYDGKHPILDDISFQLTGAKLLPLVMLRLAPSNINVLTVAANLSQPMSLTDGYPETTVRKSWEKHRFGLTDPSGPSSNTDLKMKKSKVAAFRMVILYSGPSAGLWCTCVWAWFELSTGQSACLQQSQVSL